MVFSLVHSAMGNESFAILQKSLERYLRMRGAVLREKEGYTIRLQLDSTMEYAYTLTPEKDGVCITASCDCDVHAAMGHLLFLLDIREEQGFTPLEKQICHNHRKSVRGMYFATHFYNFYHSAPLEKIYEVIEDLAMQGCNHLLVWFDMHHFASMQDPDAVELAHRLKKILSYGKKIGMGSAMTMLANESFANSPEALRAQWLPRGKYRYKLNGHFHIELCPSTEAGMAEILRQRQQMLEYFRDLELDYVVYWPYDQGGCTCEKCEPWGGNGFLKILPHFIELTKTYFPRAEVVVSAWDFDGFIDGEWDILYQKLAADELYGIKNVMAFFYHGKLPECIAEKGIPDGVRFVDFPEISMHSTDPWGAFGGVLDLDFLEESRCDDVFDGGYPYSEGLFECVNKFVILSCFYSGRFQTAGEALRGFIQQYFCCNGQDMYLAMEKMQHNTKNYYLNEQRKSEVRYVDGERQYNVDAPLEDIDFVWNVFQKYNRELPARITAAVPFRLFYLRSVMEHALSHNDYLFSRSKQARDALLELEKIYYTSERTSEALRLPVNFVKL